MASKYKHPALVTCPRCAARSSHRVANLLALTAICPNRGSSLTQVGQSMRNGLDEWGTFVAAMLLTLRLEDRLGIEFTDDEVHGVKRLRDLAELLQVQLEQRGESASRSVELTTWAVRELPHDPWWGSRANRSSVADNTTTLDFDAPLLDVVDPDRWK